MTRRLIMLCMNSALCMFVLALPGVIRADTIFTNFGPSFSYNTTGGNAVGNGLDFTGFNYAEGDAFVPAINANLGSIEIALSYVIAPPDPFTVSLASNAGDKPGPVLESFVIAPNNVSALGTHKPPLVLNSILNPLLTAGIKYWVTVDAPFTDSIVWNWNNTGDTRAEAISTNGAATWFSPSGLTPGAFEVDSPASTAVPEPGTLGLLAAGLLMLAGLQKRLVRRPQ